MLGEDNSLGKQTTRAGINGLLDSTLKEESKSIAIWAGGDMLDLETLDKDSDGNYIIGDKNPADFLIRMDGTGYAAGGALSWDENGKITADEMSFFIGESKVGYTANLFKYYVTPINNVIDSTNIDLANE
jgi:hypothetical protein